MIPKAAGLAPITKLCPIALQNVKKKWMKTIVLCKWKKSSSSSLSKGLLVSFVFSNTFPTLPHTFVKAFLRKIQLTPFHIQFILLTLVARYHFCVGKGVVREFLFSPKAGIGQGDPFSPLQFSFCASFVLFCFDPICSAHPYMYGDDLCILITNNFSETIQKVIHQMHDFGKVSPAQSWKISNSGKSKFFEYRHDLYQGPCHLD